MKYFSKMMSYENKDLHDLSYITFEWLEKRWYQITKIDYKDNMYQLECENPAKTVIQSRIL